MKHSKLLALPLALIVLGTCLAACERKTQTAAPAAPAAVAGPEKPVASVIDLMMGQIDPAADFIWESVATISTPKGMIEHQPRTDAEWLAVRLRALQLAEAANLLMMPGRRVAHDGQHLEDEGTHGNLTTEEAQIAVDSNRDTFLAYAAALRDTAVRTIEAIDKRNVDAYLEVGGQIDEACEQCHLKFWYPGATPPPTAMR